MWPQVWPSGALVPGALQEDVEKEGVLRIHDHAFFSPDQGFVPGKALAAAFMGLRRR